MLPQTHLEKSGLIPVGDEPIGKFGAIIMAVHPPNPKYVSKPYEQMEHPGQRVQVDVKFVPSACLVNSRVIGKHFFQYTCSTLPLCLGV